MDRPLKGGEAHPQRDLNPISLDHKTCAPPQPNVNVDLNVVFSWAIWRPMFNRRPVFIGYGAQWQMVAIVMGPKRQLDLNNSCRVSFGAQLKRLVAIGKSWEAFAWTRNQASSAQSRITRSSCSQRKKMHHIFRWKRTSLKNKFVRISVKTLKGFWRKCLPARA